MDKSCLKPRHCNYSVKEVLKELLGDVNFDIGVALGIGAAFVIGSTVKQVSGELKDAIGFTSIAVSFVFLMVLGGIEILGRGRK
jgi:hypothetical protein